MYKDRYKTEMTVKQRFNRVVPKVNKVIDFEYKGKKLSGKVAETSKKTDCFEVVSNGTRFLVDFWDGRFLANCIIKNKKF